MLESLATPFDRYVADITVWVENMWFVWLILSACVVVAITGVMLSKHRAKANARVPHYRRNIAR